MLTLFVFCFFSRYLQTKRKQNKQGSEDKKKKKNEKNEIEVNHWSKTLFTCDLVNRCGIMTGMEL